MPQLPHEVLPWWDDFKAQVVNQAKLYGPLLSHRRTCVRRTLETDLLAANAILLSDPTNSEAASDRDAASEALAALTSYSLQGSAIRSHFFHSHISERVPKYLARYELSKAASKLIPSLSRPDGTTTQDTRNDQYCPTILG